MLQSAASNLARLAFRSAAQPSHRYILPSTSALPRFLSGSSDSEDKPGRSGNVFSRALQAFKERTSTSADATAEAASVDATADAAGVDGASTKALVTQNPDQKHRKVLVVELARKPLFPGIYTPVQVKKNEQLIREVLEAKKAGGQAYVGAFLRKSDSATKGEDAAEGSTIIAPAASSAEGSEAAPEDAPDIATVLESDPADHLNEVGTFAQVHTIFQGDAPDTAQLLLLGHRRIRRVATFPGPPLKVGIVHLKDQEYAQTDYFKATCMEIVNTLKELLTLNPLYGEQFKTMMSLSSIDLNDNSRLIDAAASLTSADEATLQAVLEQVDVKARAEQVMLLLKKEVELCRLQADIREQVETKIAKEQRRMLLMEQLKSIKKELGLEKDDKSALLQRFKSRWEPKQDAAPEEVRTVVQEEMEKLSGLEPVSPEFNVTRNYLEWLTSLPWGVHSQEIFDIPHAQTVLDEDHYGLEDVKERILEFIAVSRLRGSAQGKILCLVGPPGVGKTSIGRSIARTLNRKYYRFSVGGLYDVAEIKGHRRTYVGAMPGKMVQCLKNTGASNPLVLIDEIDKLGRGHTGDPASALLELLDPEQNASFLDHYLDVPIDLSKVLFVCTANVLDTIPGPLLDRMEVIRLSGYAAGEKAAITRRYLEPAARQDAGVPDSAVTLTEPALSVLINEYAREAGVRNLKKHIEKIYRKAALQLVKDGVALPPLKEGGEGGEGEGGSAAEGKSAEAVATSSGSSSGSSTSSDEGKEEAAGGGEAEAEIKKIVVGVDNLKDFVGHPPFGKDRFYEHTPPGVVMGLAWTAMGGATLYVEAAKVEGSEGGGSLHTTGQLGDVFRESATIAHTFARNFLADKDPHNKFFNKSAVHVHVPAGATPKDGPSAGCTLITALLSLALGREVRPDLAMTGEVTLTGRVLPIGGVKEKVLAARRSGVKVVVFPEANQKDWEELSADLKEGLEPHFVAHYHQIFQLALEHSQPIVPTPPPQEEEVKDRAERLSS